MMPEHYDVAIIGGGPGGSTTGALLKKYNPGLRVLILEKEKFPREHVGESQLPPIGAILHEMGCWDKVEAAEFPIKVGVTFRWGRSPELWDFELLPLAEFRDEPRPGRYEGFRKRTAFQVERALYDQILLEHARELGCEVREQTQVTGILHEGDTVTGLQLRVGEAVTARTFVDASGHLGVLRRAMGVTTDVPTRLQNIAIYDYWDNAEWAVEVGVGGTRVQIMSLPYGWIWFIPLGPTRTSIGLVCPAEFYRRCGKRPEELYHDALRSEERIARLCANAACEGAVRTTKDWSFLAERTTGDNWFLVGEAAGFADPILSAGLTLTQTGARECAYSILELERGELDAAWIKATYDENQRARVRQHIRFADFWYAANGQLTDLQDHCAEIAREAGVKMTPQAAWRWIAQGGFANDIQGQVGIGGLDLAGAKQVTQMFTERPVSWQLNTVNVLKLNLVGAEERAIPIYADGRISATQCHHKSGRHLPMTGMFELLVDILRKTPHIGEIHAQLQRQFSATMSPAHAQAAMLQSLQTLEVMLEDGWLIGKLDKKRPKLTLETPKEGTQIHPNRDPIMDTSPSPG